MRNISTGSILLPPLAKRKHRFLPEYLKDEAAASSRVFTFGPLSSPGFF